ncbi:MULTISPECIES: hypothetical protein [unclassified Arenibacter]|uniref:hypothetical protein n=1 Tax=unclassified Arenibacter TaxID=2615047 RepID=UPI000E34D6D8|nr:MULTISPECIES: hypothetical protein [unclassified Arenibacter]MCM4165977.1 hypothetical protein [Arenibacter sp. A80]RFT54365.1 hypothetical protein D0S24_20445 [Arenibacter sp. P308M17]
MKTTILIIFILLFPACQGDKKLTLKDSKREIISSEVLLDSLYVAYNENSEERIKSFFREWNNAVPSISSQIINESDTLRNVFKIFKQMYRPCDLLKLGDWEWGNKLNSNSQYVIVQKNLTYVILETTSLDSYSSEDVRKITIENFRPSIHVNPDSTLYLTSEYENALNKFLEDDSSEVGEENIMNPSQPKNESKRRYDFLRKYIPILHGHWGGLWHLETHPEINLIVLDKTLSKALVFFRVGFQGGEAQLTKNNNAWIIENSEATWIE